MTSISSLSSAASIVSYSPSLDKNGDGVVSADELAAASAAGTQPQSQSAAQPSDDDSTSAASGAAAKFVSLLMQLLMQLQGSDPSQSAQSGQSDQTGQADQSGKGGGKHAPLTVADLDTDGDGSVSAAEFTAAKPDNVTDKQSADFFAKLDKDGSGSLDETELQAMQQGHAHGAHGHHGGGPSMGDLDSDGDGSVTQAEFSAAKPDDVTDDQSTNLFSELDTDGNGVLDANELQAMQDDKSSMPMPPADETDMEDGDMAGKLDDVLAQLQRFAQQFFDDTSDASSLVPTDA